MQNNIFRKGLIVGLIFLSIMISTISTSKNIKGSVVEMENNNFYYTYDEFTDLLKLLQTQHPEIFSYYSLNKTYDGRNIWLVKISDNVSVKENEPQILIMGGVHGNEKPGFQAVIYCMKSIVENYTKPAINESFTMRIRNIVNSTEIFFIPMVNPDGIEAFTRKNCRPNKCIFGKTCFRGVDINRNYDYNWEDADKHPLRYIVIPKTWDDLKILLSGNTTNYPFERTAVRFPLLDFRSPFRSGYYRGPRAFSENESNAIRNFIEKNNVSISVDYHIGGEGIGYPRPWSYTHPVDNSTFFSLAENISKINGYKIGQRPNWSNVSGGFGYWAYSKYGMFSFTIELCKSMEQNWNPDEEYLLRLFYAHLLVNLYLAEKATM